MAVRATLTVAAVYGYFLIFAQFSFVELLRSAGLAVEMEQTLLGAMALTGVAAGFLTAWRGVAPTAVRKALLGAAVAAAMAPMLSWTVALVSVAIATGAALGVATVSLSALLPAWCGVVWVGVGTGIGYAACNVPAVFQQPADVQAWIGAGFAVLGAMAMPGRAVWAPKDETKVFPLWGAVALFTALVWMDSAAFFIIQHAEDLKSGTWGGALLWRNASVHLVLACVAGWWLARGGARSLPGTAWVLLAVAALNVNHDSTRSLAGWFYPAGVSLYSAALVAWPGWFSGASGVKAAGWRAAWLFAIAGWFGSANGIGMAQALERVPPLFVVAAGAVVLAVIFLSEMKRWRTALGMAAVMLAGWLGEKGSEPAVSSAAERGRRVYVSEGCIHCHSQYVRPGSADEAIWGPSRGVEEALEGQPVLIGNRRQGPDLTNVGARRSEAWLKQHFINPRAFAPDSPMPSYAHLFEDGRGEDLVRYLKLLGVSGIAEVMARAAAWKPSGMGGGWDGKVLFGTHCAVCHGSEGHGDGPLAGNFLRPPANLVNGPFIWTAAGTDLELRAARAIKFGITGTDMPGHESLTDAQINALVDEVMKFRDCSDGH